MRYADGTDRGRAGMLVVYAPLYIINTSWGRLMSVTQIDIDDDALDRAKVLSGDRALQAQGNAAARGRAIGCDGGS